MGLPGWRRQRGVDDMDIDLQRVFRMADWAIESWCILPVRLQALPSLGERHFYSTHTKPIHINETERELQHK